MSWKVTAATMINAALRRYDMGWCGASICGTRRRNSVGSRNRKPGTPLSLAYRPSFKSYVGKFFRYYQTPFDFTVIMPSILRSIIADAIELGPQDLRSHSNALVVDAPLGDSGV